MNFQKLLKLRTNKFFFLSLIILLTNCSKEEKQKSYLAKVNDSYLTREELASLVDTSNLNASEKNSLIRDWIYNEVLYQKAMDEGITEDENFDKILQNSYRNLAIALLIQKVYNETEVEFKTSDLLAYYKKNKNYFIRPDDTYLINQARFKDELTAIKFREIALESDWEKAKQFFENKNSVEFIESGNLKALYEIYPLEVADAVRYLLADEISIVIRDNQMSYNVVQLVKKIPAYELFPFEVIQREVEKRYIAEQKSKHFENFLKELYSKSEIIIKERY
ncbi:peptidylprolyl isomerase [Ignavibacterium sp.]|uniref:peptidylprolyl isomerase n=1 Tax=Ignavibacterium sp. TaxID=2651167 RepID=UPI00307F3AC1